MKRSKEDIGYEQKTEDLAKYAKALGHPIRIAILNHLDQNQQHPEKNL